MNDANLYSQICKDFWKPNGTVDDNPELFNRAAKAYLRREGSQQPARDHTLIRRYGDITGIILCNCNGVLAAYRFNHGTNRLTSVLVPEADRQ